ncbi:MAG: YqaE/Pmp3 family membrane protein [Putridiphycobacter sp.]
MNTLITKSLMAVAAVLLITSCSTSNDVASNRGIQKRKYNKGFYMSKKSNGFDKAKAVENEVAVNEKSTPIVQEKESISKSEIVNEATAEFPVTEKTEVIVNEENKTTAVISSKSDDEMINNNEVEGNKLETVKTVNKTTKNSVKQLKTKKSRTSAPAGGDVELILLVILALILPPLAVFLYEGASTRFWIDLILALLGWGVLGFLIPGLAFLGGLIAVVYALLIVLGAI